ncbi:hypothetical protein DFP72DRAFT_1126941 [Ephemerocybe angulata]|uniref:Uncharacterized protein n=1 Tax=Ephemerocybe angulata TaxID=980116 RepID=A0A8H6HWB9_9AGAR|nr:hypothetical protein DFP72DRAFT_1126941 [Tulosesus angulatus]
MSEFRPCCGRRWFYHVMYGLTAIGGLIVLARPMVPSYPLLFSYDRRVSSRNPFNVADPHQYPRDSNDAGSSRHHEVEVGVVVVVVVERTAKIQDGQSETRTRMWTTLVVRSFLVRFVQRIENSRRLNGPGRWVDWRDVCGPSKIDRSPVAHVAIATTDRLIMECSGRPVRGGAERLNSSGLLDRARKWFASAYFFANIISNTPRPKEYQLIGGVTKFSKQQKDGAAHSHVASLSIRGQIHSSAPRALNGAAAFPVANDMPPSRSKIVHWQTPYELYKPHTEARQLNVIPRLKHTRPSKMI